jgi:predicted DNA-binding antitoxin AbrB/MazE fold protein
MPIRVEVRDKMEPRSNAMTIDVDAVYENGVLKLKQSVDLPENSEVHVTIQTDAEAKTQLGRRLRELRAEIAKSGIAPLGWDEIETEVALRRGGWREGS